jgi:hypothetical protein
MDVFSLVKDAGMLGVHGVLIVVVYILWKRMGKFQVALANCLQTGGKLTDQQIAELDNL